MRLRIQKVFLNNMDDTFVVDARRYVSNIHHTSLTMINSNGNMGTGTKGWTDGISR